MVDFPASHVWLPEGKPPVSYGFPMVFLWFSYGFHMKNGLWSPRSARHVWIQGRALADGQVGWVTVTNKRPGESFLGKSRNRMETVEYLWNIYGIFMVSIYILVGGLEHEFWFSHILGMSSSQLTNSYFSEGLKPPARIEWNGMVEVILWHRSCSVVFGWSCYFLSGE